MAHLSPLHLSTFLISLFLNKILQSFWNPWISNIYQAPHVRRNYSALLEILQASESKRWDSRILGDVLDFYHPNTKGQRNHILLLCFNACNFRFCPHIILPISTSMSSSMMVERQFFFSVVFFFEDLSNQKIECLWYNNVEIS